MTPPGNASMPGAAEPGKAPDTGSGGIEERLDAGVAEPVALPGVGRVPGAAQRVTFPG
ncbi:hypothetical protein Aros01_03691 [Streptosporangium roseum]|uniref:Uncharacterized protein n=1 Tax=Streptosporangium roseum (strain ATCC 12428 / DSM 43021 / JCM 3005 / KCTC 9067 / NCIMB 10171 / NRRL 2505 / NI 9100) TaxID=479432 RepID=D2AW55_STRRD|nr:hypothetical protein Sros_2020 [Streptosporangium roseum DSM 43021]